jgi:type IV pilus assembly protein PilO
MMKLTSGKNSSALLIIALIAALLFAVYYYVIPKKEERSSLESSIASTRSEIATIQQQIEEINASKSIDEATIFEMRQKVPATRNLDDLILNIEETQYVSGTKILSVDFNNYDTLVSNSELEDPNALTEVSENVDASGEETSNERPVSTIAKESLPPELKLITFEVNVESPDLQHLVHFIKEIEKIERIMHVDIIEFTLPGEENEFAEQPVESVEATVQVTTFYYEGDE